MERRQHLSLGWIQILCLPLLSLLFVSSSVMAESDTKTEEDRKFTAFDKRVMHERKIRDEPYVLIPYRPNYVLGSWDDTLDEQNPDNEPYETKFQISFKMPVTPAGYNWILYFGYTQLAVWQMSNTGHSSPFRDINYEPELMLYYLPQKAEFLGMRLRLINFGIFNHQSNGQSAPRSRSWNRSYLEMVFERGNNYLGLKAWHRYKEGQKSDPNDNEGDDNPDIEEYIGHGEIRYLYATGNDEDNFGLVLRDNFHGDGRGSFQLDWTFPVPLLKKSGLRVYVQYFKGYGETLIDYNKKRERFGVGVMLADWL